MKTILESAALLLAAAVVALIFAFCTDAWLAAQDRDARARGPQPLAPLRH